MIHYMLKNGKRCCKNNVAKCSKIRKKISEKVLKAHKDGRIPGWNKLEKEYGINRNWAKGKTILSDHRLSKNKNKVNEIFIINSKVSPGYVKTLIIKEKLKPYKCNNCGIDRWNNKKIVLEMHHIDGNRKNNTLENLVLLCPNCHSQTNNFKGKNKNNTGKIKVSNSKLIKALQTTKNIRQALITLDLAPYGENYARAYRLLEKIA